jgi:hypothetical protein
MITNRSYSSVFIEEWGWTRYKQIPRANSVNLANKHNKKLETLIGSTRTQIVRTTDTDRPTTGSDRSVAQFGIQP